jgi:hypothetical protein
MSIPATKTANCLGFLTAIENAELGWLGGYLLLNAAGRPLEFHCTAPVKPTRTQEILYGRALAPYLHGEQIGQTLLTKSKLTPLVLCTDSIAMLAVRDCTDLPVVLVTGDSKHEQADFAAKCSAPFALARNEVATAAGHAADRQQIEAAWPAQAATIDLLEPFARIKEALAEAQKLGEAQKPMRAAA